MFLGHDYPMGSCRMWVFTVGGGHRVRLEAPVISAVPWLTPGKARDCWASIGSLGQLVISPEPPAADTKKILDRAFETDAGRKNVASEESLSLARFIASTWPIRFTAEDDRSRLSFVLPRETREVGIAPGAKEPVVLCVLDDILEVWKTTNWVGHVRQTRQDLESIRERVSEELG
jgi:hypothetical protein